MKRLYLLFLIWMGLVIPGGANNVRIEGDVKVDPDNVDITTNVATVTFTVKWDNSWRDAFNYDGVYLFLKYKLDGDGKTWHHAFLMSTGCQVVNSGYKLQMANSTGTQDRCEGLFIYKDAKSFGASEVKLELKWKITSNPEELLDRSDFVAGKVFLSAMGIEMVYVPRGAFRIGDTQSANTFRNNDISIPAHMDILSDQRVGAYFSSMEQPKNGVRTANPPEFAVNRMNDPGTTETNSWKGTNPATGNEFWQVEFDQGVQIKNLAIESIPTGVPETWRLMGMMPSGGDWATISVKRYDGTDAGTGDDWAVNSQRTYPCTRALKVDTKGNAYKYYKIEITSTTNIPVIKNIAMTTEDLFSKVDNSVLVYESTTALSDQIGMYAKDGDTWSGKIGDSYPNGYPAFWVMKYEISQEQYVSFLNKLTAPQQRSRTIGSDLRKLNEGQYVFGPTHTVPSARNGIKLASIGNNDAPYVFANDLNPNDDYAQEGDGQTLACNYLNAGDMLAYADWCGLRPLTEMEFEKMARRPFPEPSIWGEYAWNANSGFTASTTIPAIQKGKKTERPDGNVNAGGKLGGPTRCGAYAVGGKQVEAGASFWGLMELSGNLAEIYYNANTEGRKFCGRDANHHGDGSISEEGSANVTESIWPKHADAFCLRGGSYRSVKEETTISDRTYHWGVYTSVNDVSARKDSTTTFRLGKTAEVLSIKGEVTLQNGLTSEMELPCDTICSGEDYEIKGSIPAEIEGAYRVAWFVSGDGGTFWDLIEGEEEASLHISNLRNLNNQTNYFREYQYKRYIYSNGVDVLQTRPVKIRVVDHQLTLSRHKDTVDVYDHSWGIQATVKQKADIRWWWLKEDKSKTELQPEYILTDSISQMNFLKYSDFGAGETKDRDVRVMVEAKVMHTCWERDTVDVHILAMPEEVYNLDGDGNVQPFECGKILVDNRDADNHRYKTVQIGNRCWFAENLRKSVNGSLCYGSVEANCNLYGRLYNWNTAVHSSSQGICPDGWHIPTDAEWAQLKTDVKDVFKLKSQLNSWGGSKGYNQSTIGSNESRFSALGSGAYSTNYNTAYMSGFNGFGHLRNATFWWTSSSAWARLGTTTHGAWNNNCWGDYTGNCLDGTQPHYASLTNALGWESGAENQSWMYSSAAHGAGYSLNNDPALLLSGQYMSVRCIKNQ